MFSHANSWGPLHATTHSQMPKKATNYRQPLKVSTKPKYLLIEEVLTSHLLLVALRAFSPQLASLWPPQTQQVYVRLVQQELVKACGSKVKTPSSLPPYQSVRESQGEDYHGAMANPLP